jgi:Ca2+-binding RTX toxin-like protein
VLVGETGIDRVSGGSGNDFLLDGTLGLAEQGEDTTPYEPYVFALPPQLKDLADRFFERAGSGMAVAFEGEASKDTFSGGGGNDTIYVDRGQTPDTVTCGAGTDKVFADPEDHVASDCEEVILDQS